MVLQCPHCNDCAANILNKNLPKGCKSLYFHPQIILLEGEAFSSQSDNFAIPLITARLHTVHNAKTTALVLAQTSVIYVV